MLPADPGGTGGELVSPFFLLPGNGYIRNDFWRRVLLSNLHYEEYINLYRCNNTRYNYGMRHALKMSTTEKLVAWFDLCDFTFALMRKSLGPEKYALRLRKIHAERERDRYILLNRLERGGR